MYNRPTVDYVIKTVEFLKTCHADHRWISLEEAQVLIDEINRLSGAALPSESKQPNLTTKDE